MRHIPVVSSNLLSVGYENNVLEITFRYGGTYQYFGVPETIYLGLMSASSKGEYHHRYIKHFYRYTKV